MTYICILLLYLLIHIKKWEHIYVPTILYAYIILYVVFKQIRYISYSILFFNAHRQIIKIIYNFLTLLHQIFKRFLTAKHIYSRWQLSIFRIFAALARQNFVKVQRCQQTVHLRGVVAVLLVKIVATNALRKKRIFTKRRTAFTVRLYNSANI